MPSARQNRVRRTRVDEQIDQPFRLVVEHADSGCFPGNSLLVERNRELLLRRAKAGAFGLILVSLAVDSWETEEMDLGTWRCKTA